MSQTNGIALRVADFLRHHPPFSFFSEEDLMKCASSAKAKYFDAGEAVFTKGQTPPAHFYVVRQGLIDLQDTTPEGSRLVDKNDEGDILGLAALVGKRLYIVNAVAVEETLCYSISWDIFEPLLEKYPQAALHVAAGFTNRVEALRKAVQATQSGGSEDVTFFRDEDAFTFKGKKKVISCTPSTSLQEAATIMSERRIGSILVCDDKGLPVGIMTDTDFRKKVVANNIPVSTPISKTMSSPVFTIAAGMPVAQVVLTMMKKNIRHLCVTEDGTSATQAIGLISEHDVLLQYGNNPAILVKEMGQAASVAELADIRNRADKLIAQYLAQQISIPFIWSVVTSINDALIARCIVLAEKEVRQSNTPVHDLPYCWLAVGSEGRSEQILRTDQDNALIYATPPAGMEEEAKTYFLTLARLVNDYLEECGFEKCPGEVMAGNPKWCQTLPEWKKAFHSWIAAPEPKEIMHCGIFFDFRAIAGEESLADELRESIRESLKQEKRFLTLLAKHALQNPPPLSFFRNFIVEKGGENKNEFDIKLRALMPLVEAARVLAFDEGVLFPVNTNERLEALIKSGSEACRAAATAYRLLSRFRAHYGFKQQSSGRYISPQLLDKVEREVLRNTFSAIDDIQKLLTQRFKLDILR